MTLLSTVFIILLIFHLVVAISAGRNPEDEGLISINSQILEIERFLSSETERDASSLAQIWKTLGAISEYKT